MGSRLVWRLAACAVALCSLLILALFLRIPAVSHRPSPVVRMTVSQAEIRAEDDRLRNGGLVLRDGSFLKEHPFEPPWTSHSLLVPSPWRGPVPGAYLLGSGRVRADHLLPDLDVLEAVMQRAYGGWDTAAARGWNWNDWFARWRNKLSARGSAEIPIDDAFSPIDALIAFQRDNHTRIPLRRWSTTSASRTSVLAQIPAAACTEFQAGGRVFPIPRNDAGQRVRTAQLWSRDAPSFVDAAYIATPDSFGTPEVVHCDSDWISLQPLGRATGRAPGDLTIQDDHAPVIERLAQGIAYARLPSFNPSNYGQAPDGAWPKRQPDDRVLIVDLRNNAGGAYYLGVMMLQGWVSDGEMISVDQIGSEINASCLYPALRWNSGFGGEPQMMLDAMARPYPPGCPRAVTKRPAQWTWRQHRFSPKPNDLRIVAVVNSGCGSDCELMTELLASRSATLIVGSNTFGVAQFIQPGYSTLPSTGLDYRIALGTSNIYGDNRSFDGYGLDVDVVVPEVDSLRSDQLLKLAQIVMKLPAAE